MFNIHNSMQSLDTLTKRMDTTKKVYFTRFGDNDIMMMSGTDASNKPLGRKPHGGNRTVWSKQLQKEMINSFLINDPCYLKGVSASWEKEAGMSKGCFAPFPYNRVLIQKVQMFTKEREFFLPVLFHYLISFKPALFNNFIKQYIKGKKILFIGSTPQGDVEKIIGKVTYYVNTPPTQAYESIDVWWKEVEGVLDKDIDVIIPTCGQCSRVVQGRLWNLGIEAWSIDMGSLFDVFRKPTRTWLKMVGGAIKGRYSVI